MSMSEGNLPTEAIAGQLLSGGDSSEVENGIAEINNAKEEHNEISELTSNDKDPNNDMQDVKGQSDSENESEQSLESKHNSQKTNTNQEEDNIAKDENSLNSKDSIDPSTHSEDEGEKADDNSNNQGNSEEDPTFITTVSNPEPGMVVLVSSVPSPDEVESALDYLMKQQQMPDSNMRPYVLQLISRKKVDALVISDYLMAEKLDKAASMLNHESTVNVYQQNEETRRNIIVSRSDALKEKLRNCKLAYDQKEENCKHQSQDRLDQLDEKHRQQIEQFKKQWQSEDFLRNFNRPSAQLLQLRHAEKKMALSKLYAEARSTKKVADKLQIQEEEQMQSYIEAKMREEYIKLKQQQKYEVERQIERNLHALEEIKRQRAKETQQLEYAIRQASLKQAETLNPRLHSVKYTDAGLSTLGMMSSPRTLKKLNAYQNQKRAQLHIKPADDSFFQQLDQMKINDSKPKRARSSLPPL